jgi:hypothetical protein
MKAERCRLGLLRFVLVVFQERSIQALRGSSSGMLVLPFRQQNFLVSKKIDKVLPLNRLH